MTDPRLEKCCSRIHELGGNRSRRVGEDEIRLHDAVLALNEELEDELKQKKPNNAIIQRIEARIILKKRDILSLNKKG